MLVVHLIQWVCFSSGECATYLFRPKRVCGLLRFRSDDAHAGTKGFDGCRHPAYQPAAPYGYDYCVEASAPGEFPDLLN